MQKNNDPTPSIFLPPKHEPTEEVIWRLTRQANLLHYLLKTALYHLDKVRLTLRCGEVPDAEVVERQMEAIYKEFMEQSGGVGLERWT